MAPKVIFFLLLQVEWKMYSQLRFSYIRPLPLSPGTSSTQVRAVASKMQCCGSGMIYSGSGSSYDFSELRIQMRIRIQPILFKQIWTLKKHTLNSIKKEILPTIFRIHVDSDPQQHCFKGSGSRDYRYGRSNIFINYKYFDSSNAESSFFVWSQNGTFWTAVMLYLAPALSF